MRTNHLLRLVVASMLLLAFAGLVQAAERNYWRHSKGHFENTTGNKWTEKTGDGFTFHFVEVERNDRFVELFDKSRDVTVRLFGDRCMVKGPMTDGKFEKYYEGEWGR